MSPRALWRRSWLNQPRYSTIANSSCSRVRQTRSEMSSVLKESTNDSASALSRAVSDRADRGEHGVVVEFLAVVVAGVLGGFNWSSQHLDLGGMHGQAS